MFKATSISPICGCVSTRSHRSGFIRAKQTGQRATSILNTRPSSFDQLIRITVLVSLQRAFSFIERHRFQIRFADQDCLNGLCKGRWGRLESAWNVLPARASDFTERIGPKPKIVHFARQFKPWQTESNSPFRAELVRFALNFTDSWK